MKLHNAINLFEEDIEIIDPKLQQDKIIDALKSDKPDVELKNIFGSSFYPKILRWLKEKLEQVSVDKKNVNNLKGGILKAKLDKYLEIDSLDYEENIEILIRELIDAYEKWNDKIFKDNDLPVNKGY